MSPPQRWGSVGGGSVEGYVGSSVLEGRLSKPHARRNVGSGNAQGAVESSLATDSVGADNRGFGGVAEDFMTSMRVVHAAVKTSKTHCQFVGHGGVACRKNTRHRCAECGTAFCNPEGGRTCHNSHVKWCAIHGIKYCPLTVAEVRRQIFDGKNV